MRPIVLLAAGFLAGGLCVALIATFSSEREAVAERERANVARAEAVRAQEEAELAAVETSRAAATQSREPEGNAQDERRSVEGWYSNALQVMALEGIERGWAEVRDDELPPDQAEVGLARFREEVEALPPRIGRELGEQRSLDEIVAAGIEATGVFKYLELLDEEAIGPFPDMVEDSKRFGALFDCSVGGPTLDGREFALSSSPVGPFAAGTTLRFGAGVTRVNNWNLHASIPACLTIEGAGMNATLLLSVAIHDYKRIENLQIRDCTLLATGVDALDFRGRGSVVRLERVRIIGFDAGAGGSNALSLDHTALFARDCRFEGGFGRNPEGAGSLFDVRTSALLARFERCRFDAMELELERLRDRASVVFADCAMTDLRDRRDPRTVEHPGIRLVNCSVQMAAPDPERDWKRDLNDLFPGWQTAR